MQAGSLPRAGSLSIAVADGEAVFYGATVDNATEDPGLQVARENVNVRRVRTGFLRILAELGPKPRAG